jgi:hypothetical protein
MTTTDTNPQAVVVTTEGRLEVPASADLIAYMEARGFALIGYTSLGGPLREELRGQPRFHGVLGPMYGGPACALRYECAKTYAELSR